MKTLRAIALIMVTMAGGSWSLGAEGVRDNEHPVVDGEAIDAEEVKEERYDFDGDGVEELVRVTWQAGGSDMPIRVEVFRGGELLQTLGPVMGGIQSNYALRDTDSDGRPELMVWSGLWDPRLKGEDGVEEYEGHSSAHRYMVATYKWIRSYFQIWDLYTTKTKYDAYPDTIPQS